MLKDKKSKKNTDNQKENHDGKFISKTPSVMGVASESLVRFQKDLFEFGRRRALEGMDYREDSRQIKSLLEHAEAMAREQSAEIFNPKESLHDKILEEDYERAKEEQEEIKKKIPLAEEEYRKRADALSELGEPPKPPSIPWWTFVFAVPFIALTVSPSIHDFFFAEIENWQLGWFLSLTGGIAAGLFIGWCLVGTHKNTASLSRYVGLIAGLLFSLALLLIRIVSGGSFDALMFAIGLALLEVSVVVFLDWEGQGLRRKYRIYKETVVEFDRRQKLLSASAEEIEKLKEKEKEIEKEVKDYINHLYERESRAKQVDKLIESARKAIIDGYRAGLAENEGRLLGRNFNPDGGNGRNGAEINDKD